MRAWSSNFREQSYLLFICSTHWYPILKNWDLNLPCLVITLLVPPSALRILPKCTTKLKSYIPIPDSTWFTTFADANKSQWAETRNNSLSSVQSLENLWICKQYGLLGGQRISCSKVKRLTTWFRLQCLQHRMWASDLKESLWVTLFFRYTEHK